MSMPSGSDKKQPMDEGESELDSEQVPSSSAQPTSLVIVHPLVLLSVIDHYTRVARDTSKRVVGALLGTPASSSKIDITNSYAIPFEEDAKDASSWYLDRQYHEDMYAMFRKVNAAEKVVGWYSTGPKLKQVDLAIHELFRAYTPHPVLVMIGVGSNIDVKEIPTTAYISIESSPLEQHSARRQFAHLPSTIGANEAEEVGVEHLLRNLRDSASSSLTERVKAKIASLEALRSRLRECEAYLSAVVDGKLPINLTILARIQDMFNLMPDLTDPKLTSAITLQSNDQAMLIYISSLIRSILAVADLIGNRLTTKRILKERETAEALEEAEKAAAEQEKLEKEQREEKDEKKAP